MSNVRGRWLNGWVRKITPLLVIALLALLVVEAPAQANGSSVMTSPEANGFSLTGDPQSLTGDPQSLTGDPQSMARARAQAQWAWQKINLTQAQSISKGRGVIVAVLDTGVNDNHPFLQGRVLRQWARSYVPGDQANDASDKADGVVNNVRGHGTFIAGLILQVAPEAQILPIRVLDADGIGTDVAVAAGLNYAVSKGAKVINLSLGMDVPSVVMQDAITRTHTKASIISAAGNDARYQMSFPAAHGSVISVTATDENDRKASYANWYDSVQAAAPGNNLYSTFWDGGWAVGNGTSFATAIIAGNAALIKSKNPSWSVGSVNSAVKTMGLDINPLNPTYAKKIGRTRTDSLKAVQFVR